MRRRSFLLGTMTVAAAPKTSRVETVRGPVEADALGITLMHEHVLVDFIGAGAASPSRYDAGEVFQAALPKLAQARKRGCQTFVECTPAYLGRDVRLLRRLSEASGLHIITNTGYYGANGGKHIPEHAYAETSGQLALRWTREWREGIAGSGIKPGFIKSGVDAGPLPEINRKLVTACALCHKATGLRLHIHTGDGKAAMEILRLLEAQGVPGSAYVWVHAQNEKNPEIHEAAAKAGAWLEFDGVHARSLDRHVEGVVEMMRRGHADCLLVSQDSGWYHVGEPCGGEFHGYTYLFDTFVPALKKRGIQDSAIRKLLVDNPARALTPQ